MTMEGTSPERFASLRELIRPWRTSWLLASMLGAFVVSRVIAWVLSLPVGLWGDSPGYLPGPSVEVPEDGVLYFGRLSLLGIDAIRPWTVTIPFALQPVMELRSAYQLVLSMFAFAFLATALLAVTRVRWIAVVLVAVTFLFGATNQVSGWDSEIGRESTSISLAMILMALAILTVARISTARVAALLVVGTLLAVTRSSLMPLVLGVVIVPVVLWFGSVVRHRGDGRRLSAKVVLIVGLGVILLAYPVVYSSNVDAGWEKWYGRTQTEAQMGYLVSEFNPEVDTVIEALSGQGPDCLTAGLPVKTELQAKPWYFTRDNEQVCPGTVKWVNENWWSWFGTFVITHPAYAGSLAVQGARTALTPASMANHVAGVPQPVPALFFPTQVNPDQGVDDPSVLWLALVVAGLWALSRLRVGGFVRRQRAILLLGVASVLGGLAAVAMNLVLVPASALDTQRLSVAATLSVRWVLVATAAGVVCAVVSAWRRRRPAGPAAGENRVAVKD